MDGCHGGWVASADGRPIEFYPRFSEILKRHEKKNILVDVPQGLTDEPRSLDGHARQMFDVHPSSIFPVPCRRAVYASNYREACEISYKETGKKISRQAWNIGPKVREVDKALRSDKDLQGYVYESHPEICFAVFKGNPMSFSKRRPEGIAERLDLLSGLDAGVRLRFSEALENFPRSLVARDDIVDAMVLEQAAKNFEIFQKEKLVDSKGLAVRLAVPAHASEVKF